MIMMDALLQMSPLTAALLFAFFLVGVLGFKIVTAFSGARKGIPKMFRPLDRAASFSASATTSKGDPTRNAFRAKKLPSDIDYVFVGSGIGSMYCAALLSRVGYKCVVLEQHYVAGGCTHSFEDQGYHFDTGLHYVGRIEKYKTLLDLVSVDPDHQVEWAQMGTKEDGYCYDEIKLGTDEPIKFRAGEKEFVDELVKTFPEERDAIEKYLALCKRANKLCDMYFYPKIFSPWLQSIINFFLNREYFDLARKTTWEVVSSFTSNERLKAVLCGQYGNYGLKPSDSSFIIQAGIVAHYLGGAYYPIGGSQQISRALIPTIEKAGGRVFVKARVTQIVVDSLGQATGVKVAPVSASGLPSEDEMFVAAKIAVVSGAGAVITNELVPKEHRAKLGYHSMLKKVEPSISHVYAFVGMKGDAKDLGLRSANMWAISVDKNYGYTGVALDKSDRKDYAEPGTNPWKGVSKPEDMLMYLSFPSCKDPSFKTKYPGKSTCEIISVAHPQWFERFLTKGGKGGKNPNQSGKRGGENSAEYAAIKEDIKKYLLEGLHTIYPKTRGNVDFVSVATPLTNQFYLNRPDSYGLEHTPEHYSGALDRMRPQTNINGLFVTGQDVASVGIVGALNGGILTAHAMLGYGFLDLVVAKRNLIEDIMAMDKKRA